MAKTLIILVFLALTATTSRASTVVTWDSPEGQNIRRAADYLDKVLGESKVAAKMRDQLRRGKYYVGKVDGNAETGCLDNTTISPVVVKAPVNGGTLCEASDLTMDLFLSLVRTLFHEMIHVDQSFFGSLNPAQREREAWEGTMEAMVRWTETLWAQYRSMKNLSVCERIAALKKLQAMIRVAHETYEGYKEQSFANFLYWWKAQLAKVDSLAAKVEAELAALTRLSALGACDKRLECGEPSLAGFEPSDSHDALFELETCSSPITTCTLIDSGDGTWVCGADLEVAPLDVIGSAGNSITFAPLAGREREVWIAAVGQPHHGKVSEDGSLIRYTPAPGFIGRDGFWYEVTDIDSTAMGWVAVEVTAAQ